MTKDKTILIRNIYYMLSYAFRELKKNNYENIAKEDFEHIHDLFAEILYRGISAQLKRGLHREYIEKKEILATLKGRIDIKSTISEKMRFHNRLCCEYDNLSENNLMNQILKTTISSLLHNKNVNRCRKTKLRLLMVLFSEIDELDIRAIRWDSLIFQRNNQLYRMLMNICYFILDGLLMTTETGEYRMPSFTDEHMNQLFEHFVLEYYRTHHKNLCANPDKIKWNIDQKKSHGINYLPEMKSDITLHCGDHTLIIDTKYYKSTVQNYFNKNTIHSANLYQIFTYIKNYDSDNSGKISGLLLYAKTEEDISPDMSIIIDNNRISVRTIDLNLSFNDITKQLDEYTNL